MEKYGRSLHAPISLGTTSDDRFMPADYLSYFANLPSLTLTEKLDGQNNCFKKSGLYARSHTSPSKHPWDKPLLDRWNLIKNDLDDIELFGEGMYGIHSIQYSKLESYFYLFGVKCKDKWLSWEEVKFYAELFDFPTVPEIDIKISLSTVRRQVLTRSDDKNLEEWLKASLGMDWKDYVKTPGQLGGQDIPFDEGVSNSSTISPTCEGFVIRNSDSFSANEHTLNVQSNEFSNLFKLVRKSHVKTDEHWTKHWKPAKLIDYNKYNWMGYSYLG